jgi:carbon monoxide dehydrogenase subunit G
MNFENTFTVDAPIDEVYAAMIDLERVAPCVPGAEVLEQTGDDSYNVAIKVKVGPMSMTYRGTVEIAERDPEAHTAKMRARAKEARGQGTASADVTMALEGDGSSTKGTMTSDVTLSGRVASMGRGIIQDVSARIIDTFSDNLQAMLSGGGAAAEPEPEPAAQTTAQAAAPTDGAPAQAEPAASQAPPREAPAAGDGDDALPVFDIVGPVIARRLRDPRFIAGVVAALAVLLLLRGRRNG